jgi:hypothetical protein
MRKSELTILHNTADDLFQDVIRKTHKKCLHCGGKCELGHHFIPKSKSAVLRYEMDNIIPLCKKCHFIHHFAEEPSIVIKAFKERGELWYKDLMLLRKLSETIKLTNKAKIAGMSVTIEKLKLLL